MADMQAIFQIVDGMTTEELDQLLEYAKNRLNSDATKKSRVLGLFEGKGWISEDFTAELPDEFWGFDKGFDV